MAFTRCLTMGFALVAALFAAACGAREENTDSRETRQGGLFTKSVVEQPANYYYRITAGYRVKETGEYLGFDFVVACGATVTHWRYTGPSTRVHVDPQVMIMPTSSGRAVMLRSYSILCRQGVNWGENKEFGVPLDVLPFVIWFDDASDLSFGWGYATEDAYHNANSKLEFEGAAVKVSSFKEWKEWREKAAADYVQVGAIPGPWGYSYGETPEFLNKEITKRNGGKQITDQCSGYIRLPASKELIEKIWASAPDHNPSPPEGARYFPITGDFHWLTDILDDAGTIIDGFTFRELTGDPSFERLGAINRRNSGFVRTHLTRKRAIGEHYPFLPISKSASLPIAGPAPVYPRKLLVADEWKGMLACGGDSGAPGPDMIASLASDAGIQVFDPDWRSKKFPIYINDALAVEDNFARPYGSGVTPHMFVVDREGFIFYRMPWGGSGR